MLKSWFAIWIHKRKGQLDTKNFKDDVSLVLALLVKCLRWFLLRRSNPHITPLTLVVFKLTNRFPRSPSKLKYLSDFLKGRTGAGRTKHRTFNQVLDEYYLLFMDRKQYQFDRWSRDANFPPPVGSDVTPVGVSANQLARWTTGKNNFQIHWSVVLGI